MVWAFLVHCETGKRVVQVKSSAERAGLLSEQDVERLRHSSRERCLYKLTGLESLKLGFMVDILYVCVVTECNDVNRRGLLIVLAHARSHIALLLFLFAAPQLTLYMHILASKESTRP